MIAPPLALHINGLRHVTIDTFTPGFPDVLRFLGGEIVVHKDAVGVVAKDFVMAVADRVNERRISVGTVVTFQAEPVPRENRLSRVRIVAIQKKPRGNASDCQGRPWYS